MTTRLVRALLTTDALDDVFADEAIVRALVDVEVALAYAAADAGAIPAAAAEAMARAIRPEEIDVDALVIGARRTGTVAIALVTALAGQVERREPGAAAYLHWSATSQDISDTALILLLVRARAIIRKDAARVDAALRQLSARHAATVMLGRTLLQPALPITFGLKAAQWCAAANQAARRLFEAWDAVACVQFGGAAGTRAAADGHGSAIASALAQRLSLQAAPPWHTNRDRLGALVSSLGLYVAALAKIARDVSLLMQSEIGEAAEAGGGSSTLPHKRNPSGCAVVLAAAVHTPGLVAAMLGTMVQEHERAVGGWHAEWPIVTDAVQACGAAAAAAASMLEGLSIDEARMRANLDATRGTIFAERLTYLLRTAADRSRTHAIVERLLETARTSGRAFGDVVRDDREVAALVPADALHDIDSAEAYLGEAEQLRLELLAAAPLVEE